LSTLYFLPILLNCMVARFSHITRLLVIGILFTGFAAHLANPFFGEAKKTAFTQWLNDKVVVSGDTSETELRDRIKNLPKEATNFWMLVQDASKLIADHKDDFRISPHASSKENDNVSSWLIGQWSTFSSQHSSNAVLPEIVKPLQKWITPTDLTSFAEPFRSLLQNLPRTTTISIDFTADNERLLPPLISGISINAP